MSRLPKLLPIVAAALAGVVALAGPASAADSITPDNIDVELRPGQTYEVTKRLHLDAAPPKADIVIALDTTNTMKRVLEQSKADATRLVGDLKTLIPGARFALVDFRDYSFQKRGGDHTYPYALRTDGFTGNAATVQAAVDGMTNGSGGSPDEPEDPDPPRPEAYNRVFYEAVAEPKFARPPAQGGYDPEAERFLVVLGDEVPRDKKRPERDARFGACLPSAIVDPGRNKIPEGGAGDDLKTEFVIDQLVGSRQTLLMLYYGKGGRNSYLPCYQQLSQATGGDAWHADPASVRQSIIDAISGAAEKISRVELAVQPADCPLSYSFANTDGGAPPPWGPLTGPAELSFRERIKAPAKAGTYACEVRVLVDGAQRAVQRFRAEVGTTTTTTSTTTTTTTIATETTVAPPTTGPSPELPFTGAGAAEPLLLGGLIVGVVGLLTLLGTRRRRTG